MWKRRERRIGWNRGSEQTGEGREGERERGEGRGGIYREGGGGRQMEDASLINKPQADHWNSKRPSLPTPKGI